LPIDLFENYSKSPDYVENVELVGITTPGRLEILKQPHQVKGLGHLNPTSASPWVHAAEQAFVYVVPGKLGRDIPSWREDWGLVSLYPSLCGTNGLWHKLEEILRIACNLDLPHTSVAMSLKPWTFRICPIKHVLKMGQQPVGQPGKWIRRR